MLKTTLFELNCDILIFKCAVMEQCYTHKQNSVATEKDRALVVYIHTFQSLLSSSCVKLVDHQVKVGHNIMPPNDNFVSLRVASQGTKTLKEIIKKCTCKILNGQLISGKSEKCSHLKPIFH